jgi:hypothetical protein
MAYLRLIRKDGAAHHKVVEQTGLLALLATMPGVSEVALHGVEGAGWMSAI